MEFTLVNDITYNQQPKGLGETTTTFGLSMGLGNVIDTNNSKSFILSLTIVANELNYYYTNIYSISDIDSNGNLNVADITVVGEVDESTMKVTASITYLNSPN